MDNFMNINAIVTTMVLVDIILSLYNHFTKLLVNSSKCDEKKAIEIAKFYIDR